MRALITTFLFAVLLINSLSAQELLQAIHEKDIAVTKKEIKQGKDISRKTKALIDLSYYYISKKPFTKENSDTARSYLNQTELWKTSRRTDPNKPFFYVLKGELFFKWNVNDSARAAFNQAIRDSRILKQAKTEGIAWFGLSKTMYSYKEALFCIEKAIKCLKVSGDLKLTKTATYRKDLYYYGTFYLPYLTTHRSIDDKRIPVLLKRIEQSPGLSERRETYLKLCTIYGRLRRNDKSYLDSSIIYAGYAEKISRAPSERSFYDDAQVCKAISYLRNDKPEKVKEIIKIVPDSVQSDLLLRLGTYYFKIPSKFGQANNHLDSATFYYKEVLKKAIVKNDINSIKAALDGIMSVGQLHKNFLDNRDKAEYLFKYLQLNRYHGYPSNIILNYRLYGINLAKGRILDAMANAVNINRDIKSARIPMERYAAYYTLADINTTIGNYRKSNESILKLLNDTEIFIQQANLYPYLTADVYYENMRKLHQYSEVIKLIEKLYQKVPPTTVPDRFYYHFILGRCYRELRIYDKAKFHLLEAVEFAKKEPAIYGYAYSHLAVLYFYQGNFVAAKHAVAHELASPNTSETYRVTLYSWSSRIDSALNDFTSAYHLMAKSQKLNDSLYSKEKDKHIREMLFQEEEQERKSKIHDKEIQISLINKNVQVYRQEAILQHNLLTQQALLRQKQLADIILKNRTLNLLRQSNNESFEKTKSALLTKQIVIIMIILLIIVIALAYFQYKLKQKTAKTIAQKNVELERSLEEKEWLLKEMHHRVKNNLHMVVSLLDAQTTTLKDHALMAIRNSQHKVFAMSLIYQKIYQTDDLRTVNLNQYLCELTTYLKDSFDADNQIRFHFEVDDIPVDVAESVHLALIFDEIITFYIKRSVRQGQTDLNVRLEKIAEASFIFAIDNNWKNVMPFAYDGLDFDLINELANNLRYDLKIEPCLTGLLVVNVSIKVYNGYIQKSTEAVLIN